jgi:glyoxylase I family protein
MPETSTPQSKSVHHIAYTTRDVEATYDFYANKLGLPLIHAENTVAEGGYFRHFFFGIGAGEAIAFFELHGVGEEADFKTDISTGLGLPPWANHIALRLDTLDELNDTIQRMHDNGINDILEIDHGWCTSIYVEDPNGISVEFCVTTDAKTFEQSEEEALRQLRMPVAEMVAHETSLRVV